MNPAHRAAPGVAVLVAAGVVTTLLAGFPVAAAAGSGAVPVSRSIVQALLVLAIAGVLGIVAVAATGRVRGEERRGRLLDVAAALAATWTVLAAGTAFLVYLDQAPAPDSPAFGPGLVSFLADVPIGRTWAVAAACAAVLTALLVAVRSRRGVVLLWALSLLAVVPVALQAGMAGEALTTERVLDAARLVQLSAVGTWFGAVAVGGAGPAIPVAAAGAAGVGTIAALPALRADGPVGPLFVAAVVAIALSGVLAVVAAVGRRRTEDAQLLLLAVGTGLGVAADIGRATPHLAARATPAQILTGSPLPPAPSIGSVLVAWLPDPVWLVVSVGLLVGYGVAVRRHPRWPARRWVSWGLGVVLLTWLTSGAPAVYAPTLLDGVLVQTAGLLLVVPLLLAGGHPREAANGLLPDVIRSRPVVAAVVAAAVPAVIVGTDLLRWTVVDPLGREVGCAIVLLAGCWLVGSVTAADVPRRAAVGVLVGLLLLETAAAAGLGLGSALLLADWYGAMGWGTDALAVQRAAAAPMWVLLVVPTGILLIRAVRTSAPAVDVTPEAVSA